LNVSCFSNRGGLSSFLWLYLLNGGFLLSALSICERRLPRGTNSKAIKSLGLKESPIRETIHGWLNRLVNATSCRSSRNALNACNKWQSFKPCSFYYYQVKTTSKKMSSNLNLGLKWHKCNNSCTYHLHLLLPQTIPMTLPSSMIQIQHGRYSYPDLFVF